MAAMTPTLGDYTGRGHTDRDTTRRSGLSMFDPLFVGIDEFGATISVDTVFHNLLIAGEPGGGKSGLINLAAAHGALSLDTRLVLLDGKQVELGMWRHVADVFVGPNLAEAIAVMRRLLTVMERRYAWLSARNRRKFTRADGVSVIVTLIDELALFSATLGTKQQQDEFCTLLRGCVMLGRACAMPVIAATQRPSFDIIPTSLRDLFGYRAAYRCTTESSSDVILARGWAQKGYDATTIPPTNPGEGFLLHEEGKPVRIKTAWLSDAEILGLAATAARLRNINPDKE